MNENLVYSAFGALVAGGVTLLFFFVRKWFTSVDDERKELSRQTSHLEKNQMKITTEMTHVCEKLEKSSMLLDKLSEQVSENVRANGRIEGRLDEHMSMMAQYISTISHMSKQIEAVFRYIDADKRKTDA